MHVYYDDFYDEIYTEENEMGELTEEEEWFQDDCRERARDMQEYCK